MKRIDRQAIIRMWNRTFIVQGLISEDRRTRHVSVSEQYGNWSYGSPLLSDARGQPPVVRSHADIDLLITALVTAEDWSISPQQLDELHTAFAYVCYLSTEVVV